ncbi:TetR/AcrR family transcriptional regulator [Mycolicibacterium arenosum]|uniref:TetR/AcrR family transcriptional regulator n=1 Tax=Mycolicibacterium arenosum TaxID=2952157 RepID=A0ABT1M2I1_9MYCO|nr:TetR/AcrR family transcriptional regulator [Mycolicibacterium sp. CAU 1645]MCP9273343.1 TetR/AcrR family transcriptional regulator [Mycolicibacterium sp. CAU 1645]
MAITARNGEADRGQRRASFHQARAHQTKQALVESAFMLWRANGYQETTVADICRAAGVSKALFYFYFPRKEDVLFEFVAVSREAAYAATLPLLDRPYELADVIAAALTSLESHMRRNTPELIIRTIVEGYRRVVGEGSPGTTRPEWTGDLFGALFERARADGKLPAHLGAADVAHLAGVAQSLVSEGARKWAAGAYGTRSFADVVGRDIGALVAGYSIAPPSRDDAADDPAFAAKRTRPRERRSKIRK